mgnify:CR=1 FL=1
MRNKNRFAKLVSSLLVASMAAGLLAGCGGGGDQGTAGSAGNAGAAGGTESAGGSAGEGAQDGVPTYRIATVRWTDAWPTEFLDRGVMAEMEEKYGINIEWEIYYASDWAEQKSLLLASGDLPDAFLGSNALTSSDLTQNKDSFIDLSPYVNEETMPNFMRAAQENPTLLAVCTERDGTILSLPKELPLRPEVAGYAAFINKEWLDNLGLETPTTCEELEEVLYKFVTEDADGDGDPNNEIGLSGCAAANRLSSDLWQIMGMYAGTYVSRQDNYMGLDANSQPVFVPVEQNYFEAVKWMRNLWEKGILDPEYFTQDNSMYTAKLQAEGGSQAGLVFGWTADAVVGLNVGQFEVLEAPTAYDGNHYVENATTNIDIANRELIITKNCQNPEKLLAWADGFYDDLVTLQTYYGSISDGCITDNGDGTYTVNVPSDGSSLDTSAWSNSLRDFGPKYMSPDFQDKVTLPSDQGDGVKLALDEVNGKYVKEDTNVVLPVLHYTDEEESRLTTLGTDIYTYVETMYAHWVTEGGIEEEWDEYLAQLDQMGLQELLEIQRTAYAAYQESLGK